MHKLTKNPVIIDLNKLEKDRWTSLNKKDKGAMKDLVRAGADLVGPLALKILNLSRIKSFEVGYVNEVKSISDISDEYINTVKTLQWMYELSHVTSYLPPFGCTTGIIHTKDGFIHCRTLDWALDAMSPATRVINFHKGGRWFQTVGCLGYVGVLSGMVPGAYSVSINWAPPNGSPTYKNISPTVLLRKVLETCDTYEEAVGVLSFTPISTSVFYVVCGVKDACVIERTKLAWNIRRGSSDNRLVQTNHFKSPEFKPLNRQIADISNPENSLLWDSVNREQAFRIFHTDLEKTPQKFKDLIINETTQQSMFFSPEHGLMDVYVR